jgi:hypothetical protein
VSLLITHRPLPQALHDFVAGRHNSCLIEACLSVRGLILASLLSPSLNLTPFFEKKLIAVIGFARFQRMSRWNEQHEQQAQA